MGIDPSTKHYKDFLERASYCIDAIRTNAYNRFLAKVAAGATICDIGTGTGVLSYLAIRHGAKKVYALDHDSMTLRNASMILSDVPGIEYIKSDAKTYTIPNDVDFCIHEIYGNCVFDEGILPIAKNIKSQGFTLHPKKVVMFRYDCGSVIRNHYQLDISSYDPEVRDFLAVLQETWPTCIDEIISLKKLKDYVVSDYHEHEPCYTWDMDDMTNWGQITKELRDLITSDDNIGWRVHLDDNISFDNIPRIGQSWTPIRFFKKSPTDLLNYLNRYIN
jgi:hypothetical protein